MAYTSVTILDAAKAYLKRGLMPIPIPAGRKGPCLKNWQHLRFSETDLPAHFNGTPRSGNIGLLLGEPSCGLVDVDLDCSEAIELADAYLPPTPAVTGRAGAPRSHWWYFSDAIKTTKHQDPRDRSMIVELRSTGAQTLVGPSIHPSGEQYDFLDAEPARVDGSTLAAAVAALAEAVIAQRQGRTPGNSVPPNVSATPILPSTNSNEIEHRAAAYLDAMPPAVSGQSGHAATYTAATAMVHGFGLSPDMALRLLQERYNPRCQPPWSEKELRHKVDDAATKPHTKPYGWLQNHEPPEPPVHLGGVDLSQFMVGQSSVPDPPADDSSPVIRTVQQLIADFPRLRPPIIHGLLREGETMNVIASSKTGKSWLVLDLAIAVATGRPWLGMYETIPGDVLIIDNELHRETSAHRIPKVAEARGVPLAAIDETIHVENLRGRLRDIFSLGPYFESLSPGRFKVIILDAFYRFMPQGGDENDNGTMANPDIAPV